MSLYTTLQFDSPVISEATGTGSDRLFTPDLKYLTRKQDFKIELFSEWWQ